MEIESFRNISSVLIPVYNSEEIIHNCLESLANSKEIFNYNVEIILINDGSTDNTEVLIKKFQKNFSKKLKINLINHKKNLGIVAALNSGINKCKSEFIFRLDADDKWVEGRLVKSLLKFKSLEKSKRNIAIVGTYMRGSSGRPYKMPIVVNSLFQHFFGSFVMHPSWCVKGEILRKYTYKTQSPFDDYFLLLRLLLDGYEFHNIPEELVIYNDSQNFSKRLSNLKFNLRAINSILIKFSFLRFWIRNTITNRNFKHANKKVFIQEVKNTIIENSNYKKNYLIAFFARYLNSILFKIFVFFTFKFFNYKSPQN